MIASEQDEKNIRQLLSPYFDPTETLTNAAEQNLAAGVQGSNFGMGTARRLLDSEKIARQKLGHEMLEPYLQRQFQASEGAANRAAQLQAIAAEGAQALQRLQLQEAGATSRMTQEQNNALQRQAIAGQQALEQLKLGQAGDLTRTREQIAGNLAGQKLGIVGNLLGDYFSKLKPSTTASVGGAGASYEIFKPNMAAAGGLPVFEQTRPTRTIPGADSTAGVASAGTIDSILRKYGLI